MLVHVLPKAMPLHLDAWHFDEAYARITLLISSTQVEARCPACDVPAQYITAITPERWLISHGVATESHGGSAFVSSSVATPSVPVVSSPSDCLALPNRGRGGSCG
jgi:hypothetical protein